MKNLLNILLIELLKLYPKKFKLLTVACLDYKNNKSILICFICFKYIDSISNYHIFKYMNEIYFFNPQIILSDFE